MLVLWLDKYLYIVGRISQVVELMCGATAETVAAALVSSFAWIGGWIRNSTIQNGKDSLYT